MSILKFLGYSAIILFSSFGLKGQTNLVPQPMPCFSINSQNDATINGNIVGYKCITIGGETNETHVNVGSNNAVDLKAGKQISIEENGHVSVTDNGQFHASIEPYNLSTAWYEPNETPGFVGKYNCVELGFKLPQAITYQINSFINSNVGINPYDPDQIDFRVHLTTPSGYTLTRYGFYYQPFKENLSGSPANPSTYHNVYDPDTTTFPWRFRFAPNEVGLWKASVEIIIPNNPSIIQQGITFVCVPSNHKGYLTISNDGNEGDRWMTYGETGETFYALSENVASGGSTPGYIPSQHKRHLAGLQTLIDAGGNFTRFELGGQSCMPDWPVYNNYQGKLDEMFAFDEMVRTCEDNNVYFTMFRHHVEAMDLEPWELVRWDANPYKIAFNIGILDYFTNTNVINAQNKAIRYVFSRWGYSPNMAFFGYSEVDNWCSYLKNSVDPWNLPELNSNFPTPEYSGNLQDNLEIAATYIFKNWVWNQQLYILSINDRAKFTHSYAMPDLIESSNQMGRPSLFAISHVIGLHNYGSTKQFNYEDRTHAIDDYWSRYHRPIIFEEMGLSEGEIALYCCSGIDYHNSLWSTAMMGGFGMGMDWWWDAGIFDNGYQIDILRLKQFLAGENLKLWSYTPQKWSDKETNWQKRKIESFTLTSANQQRAIGWVHNATFYWRNLENNSCLMNLVDHNALANPPCYVAIDPFGYPYNTTQPWIHNDVYDHENTDGFSHNDFVDDYTDNGGYYLIENDDEIFKIKDLKSSGFINKEHYQIDFYHTHINNLVIVRSDEYETNLLGTLEIKLPSLKTEPS